MPLDRTGKLAGIVNLSVERRLSGAEPSRDAVVALAGGPGQATLPLGEFIRQAMAPALSTRDLLLFDQRGTGASNPLSCSAFEEASVASPGRLFEQCALDIGPVRGNFTTQESVQDIEALRVAGGYEKLVLYGTSYGTKVALEYAERFPQHVEALVLDSVIPAPGWEPFRIATFQAIGGALEELCSNGACAGIAANPLSDLAKLAAQLRRRPLAGSYYDGSGRRHASALGEVALLYVLEAGDLNPALRALLPAAIHSALHKDPDPLLRLAALSGGLVPNVVRAGANGERSSEMDEALFATTTCEETPFPWKRTSSPAARHAEALAAMNAEPAGTFYPFDTSTALANSAIPICERWPDASAAPPPTGPLPNVPTLILSGAQDLRTPTSFARQVAAQIPDAQVEVVPFTGHSVVGSDLTGCAARALQAFFTGAPVASCATATDKFAPTPITPTRLAYIHPPSSLRGRAGQTLIAVLDTIVDLNRQVISATLQANQQLPSGSSFGGLRGGYARLTSSSLLLRRFSFVPGVELNGSFPLKNGEIATASIRISGSLAAHGTIRIGSAISLVTGTLAGRHFSVNLARVKLSRAGAGAGTGEWPSRAQVQPLLSGPRAAPVGNVPELP